jgi:hypothetical protein
MGRKDALPATRSTLEMIGRLAVDIVIPGHGAPFDDFDAAMARALRRLESFEADSSRVGRNAVRACFTFNLLDLQRLHEDELPAYLKSVPFFDGVNQRILGFPTRISPPGCSANCCVRDRDPSKCATAGSCRPWRPRDRPVIAAVSPAPTFHLRFQARAGSRPGRRGTFLLHDRKVPKEACPASPALRAEGSPESRPFARRSAKPLAERNPALTPRCGRPAGPVAKLAGQKAAVVGQRDRKTPGEPSSLGGSEGKKGVAHGATKTRQPTDEKWLF